MAGVLRGEVRAPVAEIPVVGVGTRTPEGWEVKETASGAGPLEGAALQVTVTGVEPPTVMVFWQEADWLPAVTVTTAV